ncbi:MAG: HlyD family efflux transporter periplasmic adaptor subunit, partial [Candidatus Eiseniibacteriota bacterium]
VPLPATASGLVVRRSAEVGAELAENLEMLAIVPPQDIVFEAHVTAREAARVHEGQSAEIVAEGIEPVRASVLRTLPGMSAEDQSILIWLEPLHAPPVVAISRYGTARIETGAPRPGIGVPDSALVADDLTGEMRFVRVDSGGIAVWTTVHLGRDATGWHELLAPKLPAGTSVVISGQRGLPDSVKVTDR